MSSWEVSVAHVHIVRVTAETEDEAREMARQVTPRTEAPVADRFISHITRLPEESADASPRLYVP